ncbi:Uncharacterized conserved protein, contains HEPN domain [Algoriphagus locisalis]|uniref:Uncharacterized conserved protein, contains HEPN domain n=1 Tax=Algoriphagus locisalis TaxID=305507 RepID=A0A1I7BSR6_9BACT|nr:DUF86 domain-containing protein [Algoriphagus locisalis]SFT90250.1 Uncharacterized conserved protein, contains HEPN domain [Algoriphagus locisalis]
MIKDPVIYLEHISACIQKIEEYTKEFNEESFLQNSLIQDAVIRNFEIIGEATKKLDIDFRIKYPEIEWKKIAGMRDKLIHDYIGVDLWAVWAVVENIVPNLKQQIGNILEKES